MNTATEHRPFNSCEVLLCEAPFLLGLILVELCAQPWVYQGSSVAPVYNVL